MHKRGLVRIDVLFGVSFVCLFFPHVMVFLSYMAFDAFRHKQRFALYLTSRHSHCEQGGFDSNNEKKNPFQFGSTLTRETGDLYSK